MEKGGAGMTEVTTGGTQMDFATAVKYGLFVQAAYEMYDHNPNDLNPSWLGPSFPKQEYGLLLTIQMTDFFRQQRQRKFYGFFAYSKTTPNSYVAALRGTRTIMEAWDDADWTLVPSPLCHMLCKDKREGKVATGFLEIYKTLGVMFPGRNDSYPIADAMSLLPAAQGSVQITTTGHSLGAALITLYALEIACKGTNPTVYTFASPRVGDRDLKTKFDERVTASYRIWNYWDVVPGWPKNPPWQDQFYHVRQSEQITSSDYVNPLNPLCTHALNTYLYVLDRMDPKHSHNVKLDPNCAWVDKPRVGELT
jgi:hypothetical protein